MSHASALIKLCSYCGADLGDCHPRRKYCSRSCKQSFLWRLHNPTSPVGHCGWCQEKMPDGKRPHAQYCSRPCKAAAAHGRRRKTTPEENAERYRREKERRKEYAIQRYREEPERAKQYSRSWRISNPDKRHIQHQRRRARIRSAYVEDVDRNVVFGRDEMICQKCGIRCDPAAQWPAGNMPTLDHVVALANGGEHSYENSQTLCLACNCRKGAR